MVQDLFAVAVGLGLAAACGFRVFVPLLAMGVAVRTGHLTVSPGFAWVGSDVALIAFGVATVLEIAGYYVPWVDNLLDTVATPTAVIAGMLAAASVMTHMDPWLRWSVAVLAGGGVATAVQSVTVAGRQLSSLTTLGLGNPILATLETASSAVLAVLALLLPILALLLVALLFVLAVRWVLFRQPRAGRQGAGSPT